MKAVDIKWDFDEGEEADLPEQIEIPDEVLKVDKAGKYSSEIYEERLENISDYITNETGFCHNGFDIEIERKDAVQYCLDEGHGISESVNGGETTPAEIASAGDAARYVISEQVDYFMSDDAYVKGSTEYAVASSMCLLDFDEWNAVSEAVGLQLSYDDASAINSLLWENYDLSPLDIKVNAEATTVKEAIGLDELSSADEKQIFDIVSKYSDNELTASPEKEFGE